MASQQQMQGGYADFFHATLAPVTNLPGDVVRRRCIAVIGGRPKRCRTPWCANA